MMDSLRHQIILVVTCGIVFFFNLGAARLFDEDEPKNAECGREMYERNDWLVPTYNYDLRTDKPIMLYWLMLSSFQLFGVSEFAARLPSACMATLTIFAVYGIGRRLFDQRVAFWASIILASSLMYVTIGRISTPDSTLIGFITLSLLAFVYSVPRTLWTGSDKNIVNVSSPREPISPRTFLPQKWFQFALLYSIMGLAVLTKGPVGFLLPCAVIGLFVMCLGNAPYLPQQLSWRKPFEAIHEFVLYGAAFFAPSRFFPALWAMRPITLATVVCLVALPWYVSMGIATEGEWLRGFLGGHNIGRFSSAMEGHSGPVFYYVIAIMMGFFPWSVFLPAVLYQAIYKRGLAGNHHRALSFCLCWVGVYLFFFSIAQTKLPNYILPCYPPLALLTAWGLVRWQEEKIHFPEPLLLWCSRSYLIAGGTIAVGLSTASWFLLPGYLLLGAIGIIPIGIGVWLRYSLNNKSRQQTMNGLGIGAVILVVAAFSGIAPWVSQAQESFRLGNQAHLISSSDTPLATYDYFAPNLPFYAQREIKRFHSPEEVASFFKTHPDGLLCVREDHWEKVENVLPKEIEVAKQSQRFFRDHNVLLIKIPEEEIRSASLPEQGTQIK